MIIDRIKKARENLAVLMEDRECLGRVETATEWIIAAFRAGKKLMICGNGGSAADAQHFAAELIGRFYVNRRALPAIALTTDSSILTCIGNDYSYEEIFSRQVEGLGQEGDILIGISTSGGSKNVLKAFKVARQKKIKTVLLTGQVEREIAGSSDLVIKVPSTDTPRIQEMHLLIEHTICERVEGVFVENA